MGIYHIPRYLLPHSVTVKTEQTHDEWGNVTYSTDTLTNVRVVSNEKLTQKKNDREDSSDAVLYYDTENSAPSDFDFITGQLVQYGNESYEISGIKSVVSTAEVHHIEIALKARRST